MDEDANEGKLFATFEKHGDFVTAQSEFLALDLYTPEESEHAEQQLLQKLCIILDEYQEQSYLLDPYLEELVVPVIERLKSFARDSPKNHQASPMRVMRLSTLLYSYIKFRGYKTITRFFPHEISDLSISLDFMVNPDSLARQTDQWALRYVVLLWLGLICMIPFDLAQFDEHEGNNQTALSIQSVAMGYLGKAGLDREGAALLLSRLYMRKDATALFAEFTDKCTKDLADHITVLGQLQVLSEVAKSGTSQQIQDFIPRFLEVTRAIDAVDSFSSNTLVRKYKTKLVSRTALRLLPGRSNLGRRKGRTLIGTPEHSQGVHEIEIEVPENVEIVLEQLFQSLQDKDTVVRWSAAKGVARVAERLPTDFADQVLETIIGLFEIHSVTAASLYDLPAIAENTWHGACLACAEMARRALVFPERLPELIGWLSKALYFDIRKGSHSIGSSVRDAASYVLWALARTQSPSILGPHANNLANRIVTASLFDREIHIRRAASAAFQEFVGRTSLFSHGIDVLRSTDFYAISVRKNAFLIAAPQVAEHSEYRMFLFDHLLNVTLRHWDVAMRQLGSQSLQLICRIDLPTLGKTATLRAAKLLESVDTADIHGGILALTEISYAYRELSDNVEESMCNIFKQLALIPQNTLTGPRNDLLCAAACGLIASTITLTDINLDKASSFPGWRQVLDYGLKHRNVVVQEAAAGALSAVSKLVDCSAVVTRLIPELKNGSPIIQQSLGRALGAIDYDTFPACLQQSLDTLMQCIRPSPVALKSVEARRNCVLALPQIATNIIRNLPKRILPETFQAMYDTMLEGLEDYTIDDRGDVGSWVRVACIGGLATVSELLISNAGSFPNLADYLPSEKYQSALGGILRQGVERLDNVRQEAGLSFMKLLHLQPPDLEAWTPYSSNFFKELLDSDQEVQWNDGSWLFPKAVRFLEVKEYRKQVLRGLVVSLGSKTDSLQRPLSKSLTAYVQSLPVKEADDSAFDLCTCTYDLIQRAKSNVTSNTVVIPVLQTFNVLLEADALRRLEEDEEGLECLHVIYSLASRSIGRLKSVQRILESMKLVVNLLSFDRVYKDCVSSLSDFLAHQFPTIRSESAETLYIALQSISLDRETDEVEEILLETEWSSSNIEVAREGSRKVIELLLKEED